MKTTIKTEQPGCSVTVEPRTEGIRLLMSSPSFFAHQTLTIDQIEALIFGLEQALEVHQVRAGWEVAA